MEKVMKMRSLYHSIYRRSLSLSIPAAATNHRELHYFQPSPPSFSPSPRHLSGNKAPFSMGIGSTRFFSEDITHLPVINDPEVADALKDLLAVNWDELPAAVIYDAKNALSKNTEDKVSQEALANVFRAAEAVEEFSGMLTTLKMELDDSVGLSGENVKPLPDYFVDALRIVFQRYTAYLDSFGPDEVYLRKKVENELGAKMIHLKMRCSGLGAEWGQVTVIGTSGLAGSYVEKRA